MGLESTINTIADLNVTWPTDGDVASQGDNHLRLIKDAVKKTFPNISAVVTPTATELNKLTGLTATTAQLNEVVGLIGTSSIPTGIITMWYGSVASIPVGWYLCNGLNGTPNLVDRFVVGAGSTYAVAATGGSTTHTLSQAQLPAHTHTFSGTSSPVSNDHTHSGVTSTDPGHTHGGVADVGGSSQSGVQGSPYNATAGTTDAGGAHAHSFTTGGISANHTHTYSGTTSSVGSGSAITHLPPYYALAYIMKA